jgi:sugar/nucleoside kinase (ribokinase family)
MELKHFDILIPGNYFCDLIFSGLPKFPEMGAEIYTSDLTVVLGGVMNTVIALRRLGVQVGWVGALGNDFFSRYVLEQTAVEGLDISLVSRRASSFQRVTVALSDLQDRAFVTYIDPESDVVGMLLEVWKTVECTHLHFNRLIVDERLVSILRECRMRGIFVSMDCQHRQETLEMPLVQSILSLIDVFMPNSSEALRVTGTADLERAVHALMAYVPYLVIKDGANGAHAWRGSEHYYAPALSGLQVLDTTGAGDVFNAGFLAAHLSGQDIVNCLRWGNICGGLSTQGYGGCSTAPGRAELNFRLASTTD